MADKNGNDSLFNLVNLEPHPSGGVLSVLWSGLFEFVGFICCVYLCGQYLLGCGGGLLFDKLYKYLIVNYLNICMVIVKIEFFEKLKSLSV